MKSSEKTKTKPDVGEAPIPFDEALKRVWGAKQKNKTPKKTIPKKR